jgi:outer membrane protein assembly factor BamB
VFTLDASAGGVAVGLTSQATPLVLVSADGKTARAFGGKAEVWARDVAVSADGQVAMAGFGLGGLVSGYAAKGTRLWQHTAGILYKDDAFAWETFKDSERFLTVSPDHTRVIAAAGKEGFVAHDANTGRVLWTFPVETDPARPRGPIAAEMPWSPDGRYALVYTNAKVGDEYVSEDCLVDAATGKPVWTAPRDVSDWELYAAVGPQDAWTITAGRSSTFALRDEQGVALRVVKPEQLPSALAAEHGMIPPTVLAGLRADRVVLTKGESQAIFVMAVRLGAPAQRAAARAALRENTENAKLLYAELSGKSNPDKWTPEYIKAFMAGIVGPVQAKKLVADKMARFASEKRAGRKRDYRWISDDFALFKQLQYEEDREIIEAAADLDVVQSIALPAPLCAATIDPAMQTVYAALWDGTVRAYNVETGTPRWVARVNGGCQLALSGSALYAGGSRGDLYRLQAETGAVSWQRRLDAVE